MDIPKKRSWPECVGKKAEEAREMVSKECPDVRIQVLTEVKVILEVDGIAFSSYNGLSS